MPAVPAVLPLWSRARPARWSRSLLLVACCGSIFWFPPKVAADPPASRSPQRFQIPAGPLGTALTQFGESAGMRLLASTELTAGRQTAGISGSFTAEQALQQLLAGTGLTWRYSDEGTVLLEAAPPVEGAMMLDPVRVEGAVSASGEDRAYTTAGSSSYISQEKIERFRGTSVGDIFQGTPGVLVGEKRNGGGLDINIRGMQGQSRVPVVVDGARQETTIDRGYAGAASQSYVDPDLIGGIEITKGPSMSPDATGAVGGLVDGGGGLGRVAAVEDADHDAGHALLFRIAALDEIFHFSS